ncbi:hypothetical protein [Clostridium thermobutyricum]|uniref:hypothetical protein n=1 Tax=Clostridium thermobutyricum TaxID=29372 RepID=UPI0018ABACD1|nr:hypothetical protein [Clostridium thermobutyricum]
MKLENLSVEEIVDYINNELKLGRSMKDIEINDFKVNDRVMVKRLNRKGYKRVENKFVNNITKDIQKNNKLILNKKRKINVNRKTEVIQEYNNNINESKLLELIELLEPIKSLIEDYERNKNIIEVNSIELKPKAITKVKQKLFKIDVDILEQWEEFVLNHKEFKVQQLISLALEEFIKKYK